MPELTIDGRRVVVPAGTAVIKAAEDLGIMIPRFCYHEALGSVGACRLCAVKFLDGPVKGLEMSCMVDAQDGMVVSTDHEDAVAHRKQIIEWLMVNHPHDCPVCDEGGHCLLQDETVSGGHVIRRFPGLKRTYRDQYLGPFVQHEMNRCIHCWRCRRYYQEYSGYRDLGVMQIGRRTYFGRFEDGRLESPFAGNLIDICPTGVYTDKPSRFKGRRWDFERSPSVCLHCSLGCSTIASVRYREVIRQEARFNPSVNGYFICDRGRYGFDYSQAPNRPREPHVDGRPVTWQEALDAGAQRLKKVIEAHGPDSVLCLSSSRASLETQAAARIVCNRLNWPPPAYFMNPHLEQKVGTAVDRLNGQTASSLKGIETADFIAILGADLLNEAPMAALSVRQAWRNGAKTAVFDPRPVDMPLEYLSFPSHPADLGRRLGRLTVKALENVRNNTLSDVSENFFRQLAEAVKQQTEDRKLDELAENLKQSSRPLFICGTEIVDNDFPDLVADVVQLLRESGKDARISFILPGPNAFGASMLSDRDRQPADIVTSIEEGRIKALLLVESDPFFSYPDTRRLKNALDRLEFLGIADYLHHQVSENADVFYPVWTVFEKSPTTYINQEGRLQTASPAFSGGMPISQVSGGGHPPRTYSNDILGGHLKAATEVLAGLAERISGEPLSLDTDGMKKALKEKNLFNGDLAAWGTGHDRERVIPEMAETGYRSVFHENGALKEVVSETEIHLVMTEWTFGTEELSARSPRLQDAEDEPMLYISDETARELSLTPGDMISISLPEGELKIQANIRSNTAAGFLIVPKHRQLDWRKLPDWRVSIPVDRVKKA